MAARTVELALPPQEAWEATTRAATAIGRVKAKNETAMDLRAVSRYGLNAVTYRVRVAEGVTPGVSVLTIDAPERDVWGVAAQAVLDRLESQLTGQQVATPVRLPSVGSFVVVGILVAIVVVAALLVGGGSLRWAFWAVVITLAIVAHVWMRRSKQ